MRRDNSAILRGIRSKLAHFEVELTKLKEVTTILELVLWKTKIMENGHQDMAIHDANVRSQDRVTCGADVVIGHVLPFLINTDQGASENYNLIQALRSMAVSYHLWG
jgi:hypothetical protein